MLQIKYIVKYLLSLLNEPEQTWNYLKDGDVPESKPEYMQTNYYLPMMGVVALCLFLLTGWGEPFVIERAMKTAVSFLAAFFLGPFLATILLQHTYGKVMQFVFDKEKLQLFVGYCLSFLMAIRLLTTTFAHIKFLTFFSLYLFYIIWCGADVFVGIGEKQRWKFTTTAFFVIWLSPMFVEWLMSKMMR